MKKINILSTEMSNKIAAGEVVERPASVIKELVENSVDAGATNIIIEIKNGGISYIRVTDNGCGISPEDVKTAFLPHATSKIINEDDLFSIKTLGFRGEALASIAAVSNVEIMSKTEDENGTFLEISGGKFVKEETVGCPVGTTIVVKNLFFNTPARMKFLKKDSTEASYITDIVERLVMANPNISVRYIVDEKEKLFVSGDGELKSCIYSIYGRDYAKGVIELTNSNPNIKISGYVGKKEISRGNRAFQSVFVNGRYVKNRAITAVVENAYKNNIMVGKFPFYVMYIDVPYEMVDINVHPTKQEVKFVNERQVCDEVYWAVKGALQKENDEIREKIKSRYVTFDRPVVEEKPKVEQTVIKFEQKPVNVERPQFTPVKKVEVSVPKEFKPKEVVKPGITEPSAPPKNADTAGVLEKFKFEEPKVEITEEENKISYKIIGQLFDTYVILELDNEILLMDQHAAHERMIYEKLVKANDEKEVAYQMLLSPVAITLSAREYDGVEDKKADLEKYGFVVEDFGSNTILVRQVPVSLRDEDMKNVILDIINNSSTDYMEENIHTIACKAAIKANKKLSDKEIDELVRLFVAQGGVNTCPHGRPIMVKITRYELEKMFKRIQ
ncbi:MAG: DNA mismatch repair endonuclease MutL [Clostridia bacterium]|nr:DNA mismatch repair endonuclease MutL [Clostridia bacterium]